MEEKIQLEIAFYNLDLASIIIDYDLPQEEQYFAEIITFTAFSIRQLRNLGNNWASEFLTDLLNKIRGDIFLLANQEIDGVPIIIPPKNEKGNKYFQAKIEYDIDKALLHLNHKGFGLLGFGINHYAPRSVIILLKQLANNNQEDKNQLRRLSMAANVLSEAFLLNQIDIKSQFNTPNLIANKCLSVFPSE